MNWEADGAGPVAQTLMLPAEAWHGSAIVLRFKIGRPAAPAAIGLGDDPRALGIFLEQISPTVAPFDLMSGWLQFTEAAALPFLWHGWAPPEPSGAWTFGMHALVRWLVPVTIPAGHRLLVDVVAWTPGHKRVTGRWRINGRMAATFAYSARRNPPVMLSLPLPRTYIAGETIDLAVEIDNPASPALTTGTGTRPPGLMVAGLRIAPG
jgi:hypothetical protein